MFLKIWIYLDIEEAILRINEAHNIKYLGDEGYKINELKKISNIK